jgi:hypothetical protein
MAEILEVPRRAAGDPLAALPGQLHFAPVRMGLAFSHRGLVRLTEQRGMALA